MRLIARSFYWLTGWKTEGEVPKLKKFVAIMAPHTSAWDVVYGLFAKYIFEMDFSFFGKQEIFSTPYYGNNNVFGMTFSDIRDEAKGWDLVERQFIVKVLAEPLTWMGLITLGYTKADDAEPLAFRLTCKVAARPSLPSAVVAQWKSVAAIASVYSPLVNTAYPAGSRNALGSIISATRRL